MPAFPGGANQPAFPGGPNQPAFPGGPNQQEMTDTQRMLQPQGLFQRPFGQPGPPGPPGQFAPQGPAPLGNGPQGPGPLGNGPQPWPGSPGGPLAPPGGRYQPGDGMSGPRSPRPGRSRLRRPHGPLAPVLVAAALIVVIVIAVVVSLHGNSPGGGAAAGTTTPTASASATATGPTTAQQRQAATELAGLLAQSGSDRGAVIDAVVSVEGCNALPADEQTFSRAAANRRTLLSKLGSLPGRSALSAAMVTDLTGAWQASAQADSDLAKWAGDEISGGCHKGKTQNDPNLKASLGPDGQATTDKQAFIGLWNPLAAKFGLQTYQVNQL